MEHLLRNGSRQTLHMAGEEEQAKLTEHVHHKSWSLSASVAGPLVAHATRRVNVCNTLRLIAECGCAGGELTGSTYAGRVWGDPGRAQHRTYRPLGRSRSRRPACLRPVQDPCPCKCLSRAIRSSPAQLGHQPPLRRCLRRTMVGVLRLPAEFPGILAPAGSLEYHCKPAANGQEDCAFMGAQPSTLLPDCASPSCNSSSSSSSSSR